MPRTSASFAICLAILATAGLGSADWQETPAQQEASRPPQVVPPAPPATAQRDPAALELLRRVAKDIDQAENFSVRLTHLLELRTAALDEDITTSMVFTLAYEQPNRMRLEREDEVGDTIVSDGDSLFVYMPALNRYIEREAPSDLSGLLANVEAGVGTGFGFGPLGFVGPLLLPEAIDGEAGTFRSAVHMGAEEVGGVMMQRIHIAIAAPPEITDPPQEPGAPPSRPEPAHGAPGTDPLGPHTEQPPVHERPEGVSPLRPRVPDLVFDVWIEERDGSARLRLVHVDLARLMTAMERDADTAAELREGLPPDLRSAMWIALDEWAFDEELPEERFAFAPPEGAERAESLFEALVGRMGERAPHPLVGEPAPSFELQRLIGTQVELAEHLGRDVVILDFWATWCTPCVRAMPHLMTVADEFRDQKVVFYAVNVQEDFDTVQSFLRERGWDLKVPMDIDGRVSQLYHVRGIPQTVLIDRQGLVQAVHVGFTAGMEERLRSDVQTLVDGGSLLEKPDDDDGGENGAEE